MLPLTYSVDDMRAVLGEAVDADHFSLMSDAHAPSVAAVLERWLTETGQHWPRRN